MLHTQLVMPLIGLVTKGINMWRNGKSWAEIRAEIEIVRAKAQEEARARLKDKRETQEDLQHLRKALADQGEQQDRDRMRMAIVITKFRAQKAEIDKQRLELDSLWKSNRALWLTVILIAVGFVILFIKCFTHIFH
ncbi:MAG: hypothetical protein JWR19_4110 [Pedosphaera sp.]|nr:hypothetical protein [Pedosphaera sp.]